MLCTPHECPNQQTPQQNFSELQDHTKNMTSRRSKTYTVSTPHTNTPTTKAPAHCHNIPFHQYTSSQHNTQLCQKRIEQSTLLSSQTTHHTNNTTTHKHACSTIISRSSHDKSPQPTPPGITTRNEVLAAATHTTIHTHTHHRNPVGDEIEHQ